jgi:cytochrome c553
MLSSILVTKNSRGCATVWALLALLSTSGLPGCQLGAANSANRGRELFATCAACHGAAGTGNRELGAPGIAGLKAAYVELQLQKFRTGVRGTQFNDMEGMRMRPMALSLRDDDDVKTIAAYVTSLPVPPRASTISGDVQAGQALYATCIPCHGADGSGNEALQAPRLAGMDGWYLAAELRKYKEGIRGVNPKDSQGMLMIPMARTLADEDAIRNVVAYMETLKP